MPSRSTAKTECRNIFNKLSFTLFAAALIAVVGTVILNRVSTATNNRDICFNTDKVNIAVERIKTLEMAVKDQNIRVEEKFNKIAEDNIDTRVMLKFLLIKQGVNMGDVEEKIAEEKGGTP